MGNSALLLHLTRCVLVTIYITSIGGYTGWSNISDGRVKKNIKPNVPGLAFINKLKPITYNLDLDAADKIIQRPAIKDKDGKTIQPTAGTNQLTQHKATDCLHRFYSTGCRRISKKVSYDFSGVDAAKNDKDLYGLRYAEFVVPLVKAVQELSAGNDNKQQQIDYSNKIIPHCFLTTKYCISN